VEVRLFPYRVISNRTGPGLDMGGIIECLPATVSRDEIGKKANLDLHSYFTNRFGPESSPNYQQAQRNFIQSLAGSCLLCYLLQVKDRHNGNVLFDEQGHIIHIDFGFIFDISPGGNLRFESAAFKLTEEMLRVLGGRQSEPFAYF
jgi:phosphatidylinositol 4-kinase